MQPDTAAFFCGLFVAVAAMFLALFVARMRGEWTLTQDVNPTENTYGRPNEKSSLESYQDKAAKMRQFLKTKIQDQHGRFVAPFKERFPNHTRLSVIEPFTLLPGLLAPFADHSRFSMWCEQNCEGAFDFINTEEIFFSEDPTVNGVQLLFAFELDTDAVKFTLQFGGAAS